MKKSDGIRSKIIDAVVKSTPSVINRILVDGHVIIDGTEISAYKKKDGIIIEIEVPTDSIKISGKDDNKPAKKRIETAREIYEKNQDIIHGRKNVSRGTKGKVGVSKAYASKNFNPTTKRDVRQLSRKQVEYNVDIDDEVEVFIEDNGKVISVNSDKQRNDILNKYSEKITKVITKSLSEHIEKLIGESKL